MPGGAAAIRDPWRMAVGYLFHHFGRDFLKLPIPFVRELPHTKTEVLLRMIEAGLSTPLTSSCGRLFDAVAALAGVREQVNYEAQAAIELEMVIGEGPQSEQAYPLGIRTQASGLEIDTRPLFEALLDDLASGVSPSAISLKFHNALVEVFARLARMVRERKGLDRVCLSGGTFQNAYLLEHLTARLEARGFQVFSHAEVPAGDGGLSLGQALVAAHRCTS